jgi:hypothetical protein
MSMKKESDPNDLYSTRIFIYLLLGDQEIYWRMMP